MKVILAKSAGFCRGVRRAVHIALDLATKSNGPVYTDGDLIHNDQMMTQLRAHGIHVANDPTTLGENTLIIRAHGISPQRRSILQKLPVKIVDATCPDVARIQALIRKYARQGASIVIFGDRGHPEVIGLEGFAEGRSTVVSCVDDVAALQCAEPVCLVSQSTQFPISYDKITSAVLKFHPHAVILDTICESTKQRQREMVNMAELVEVFVIVGGKHSANTARLVSIAAALKPTYHIQTHDQLSPNNFINVNTVGLTSGASTPDFVIEAVRARLEEM
ncbi:MAG: 4-hydroxy-3-methylbut-2-enyl diphosphate reductase [Lentisphaerae bacterium]|nr:4-hydroxy-3-methylbut-2-enyl diphosphate reductase [Lentisphaerota bacterium]